MWKTRPTEPNVSLYFAEPNQPIHRQYLALRGFLHEGRSAEEIASEYGYTPNTIYTLARNFKNKLRSCKEQGEDPFFHTLKPGRKKIERSDDVVEAILSYRKKHLSVPDIKILLDGNGYNRFKVSAFRMLNAE